MRNVLLRFLYLISRRMRPSARGHHEPRTVLVLQYMMPLGCGVHGTPIFAALKAAHPDTTVVVATCGLGYAVLQHDPHIDHLIETADPVSSFGSKWAVARTLRSELRRRRLVPDLILQDACNRAGSYALLPLLLRLAPAVGFANAPPLYDRHLEYDPDLSLIDNNLRLVALDGITAPHLEPAVYFAASELAAARSLLHEANAGDAPVTAFVMQGSGGQRTGWHDERFAATIRYVESLGHRILFLGTVADAAGIERIRAAAGFAGHSFAGRTSVPELAAVLCLCDLLITLDTGTMHVGRASGLPMVVLGPCWQKPLEWLPIGKPNVHILRGEDRDEVPPEYRLDEITTENVVVAVDDLTKRFPASSQARESRVSARLSTTRARAIPVLM
jgi:ADP-heptose:LPS heptosyltransferase